MQIIISEKLLNKYRSSLESEDKTIPLFKNIEQVAFKHEKKKRIPRTSRRF